MNFDPDKYINTIDKDMRAMPTMESGNIQKRLELQEKIAANLVLLMKYEAYSSGQHKLSYQTRRIEESKSILKSNESVSKAMATAAATCEKFRIEEAQSEAEYDKIKLYRISIQLYIETTKQTNSFLKQELK
jgi:hypothetical protein